MGFKEKFKQFINVTDDDFIDSVEDNNINNNDDFDFAPSQPNPMPTGRPASSRSRSEKSNPAANNVVDINSSKATSRAKPVCIFFIIMGFLVRL